VLSRYSLYPLAGDAAIIGARIPVYFSEQKKQPKLLFFKFVLNYFLFIGTSETLAQAWVLDNVK